MASGEDPIDRLRRELAAIGGREPATRLNWNTT
jgi:hypothetical protein